VPIINSIILPARVEIWLGKTSDIDLPANIEINEYKIENTHIMTFENNGTLILFIPYEMPAPRASKLSETDRRQSTGSADLMMQIPFKGPYSRQ